VVTPEQRGADRALLEAVERSVRAYGLIPDDSTLVDFVIVVEALRYHGDDVHDEFRGLLYREGVVRTSVALGLLHLGTTMIDEMVRNNPID
jgi:hypothetical protein